LAGLGTRLAIPFADLVDSCDAAERPVCQVRLCVEVLRRAVGTPADATVRSYLGGIEAMYRSIAYRSLLSGIGTSYDELRRARGLTAAELTALAERLGFALTDGTTNHLATLLVSGDPAESWLADVFGLLPTTGSPTSSSGTAIPQVAQWRLAYLRTLWR